MPHIYMPLSFDWRVIFNCSFKEASIIKRALNILKTRMLLMLAESSLTYFSP